MIAQDYISYWQAPPGIQGIKLNQYKQHLLREADNVPESRMSIDRSVTAGDPVGSYCTCAETQKGRMGLSPLSIKQTTVEFAGVQRIEYRKIHYLSRKTSVISVKSGGRHHKDL